MAASTQRRERAMIVGITLQGQEEDTLDELDSLVRAAGGVVIERFSQHKERPDIRYYIGAGKAREIKDRIIEKGADLVVVDDELTPAQQRHCEELFGIKVIDRTRLILDIFASRAQTSEAKLEVELAQLEYLMPRLAGKGTALSQLGGGIGTLGPGETKLEMDRRRIRDKITMLKRKIKEVSEHRTLLRGSRRSKGYSLVSIVGYTNAGKSTLLNTLSDSTVYVADQPFATLDPVTRKVYLPALKKDVLFCDTVGFIRKLPHTLIDSFKATLEEVIHADVLVHVVDASSPLVEQHIDAVYRVLEELGVMTKPVVTVLNKIDLVPDPAHIDRLHRLYYPAVAVSALQNTGTIELLELVGEVINETHNGK